MLSEKAAEIFLKARTLDLETRAEFVTNQCGSSDELRSAVESLLAASNDSEAALESLTRALEEALPTRESSKHMAGRDLGRQEPTASLKYRAQEAA